MTSSAENILNDVRTAIIALDEQFRVVHLNSAAETLLETSLARSEGEALDNLFQDSDGDSESALQVARDSLAPHTKRQATLLLPSGGLLHVDYAVLPVDHRVGAHTTPGATSPATTDSISWIVELHDVDPLFRLDKDSRTQGALATSQQLFRGLAHEIKNPLGGIRGAAQLLSRELNDPDLHEYTNIIIEETDRLRALVDQMLGPNKPPKLAVVNIHRALERVIQVVQVEQNEQVQGNGGHSAPRQTLTEIVRDYDPSLPDIEADADQLIQAMLNIVRNAMFALREQREPPPRLVLRTRIARNVTIGSVSHRLLLQVDIEDNGPGIPEDIREHIFYPMVSGHVEGSGLGLPIAGAITHRHQGTIECESQPGLTCFRLLLPVTQLQEDASDIPSRL